HSKSCRKSGDRHRRFHSRSTAGLAVAVIEPAELGGADLGIAGLWDCLAAEDWLGPPGAHLPGRAGQRRERWSASWCASSAPLEIEDRPCPLRISLSGKVPLRDMTRPTLDEMYYDAMKARPTRNPPSARA